MQKLSFVGMSDFGSTTGKPRCCGQSDEDYSIRRVNLDTIEVFLQVSEDSPIKNRIFGEYEYMYKIKLVLSTDPPKV